jgi:hypothetical protein
MDAEMDRLKAITLDPRNPKCVKEAALRQLRGLEKADGFISIPYNSEGYKA